MNADTVTVKSGSVTAAGQNCSGTGTRRSFGILGSVVVSGGSLIARGGDVSITGAGAFDFAHSIGINGGVTVTGGELTAIGGTATSAAGGFTASQREAPSRAA